MEGHCAASFGTDPLQQDSRDFKLKKMVEKEFAHENFPMHNKMNCCKRLK